MMKNGNSLTVIQMNDSHAYFDLHQEMFWQDGHAVYRPAGGYARMATLIKQVRSQSPTSKRAKHRSAKNISNKTPLAARRTTQVWGGFTSETEGVYVHDSLEPGDEDLLDLTAIQTLIKGDTVYVVSPEKVPDQAALAASLRY